MRKNGKELWEPDFPELQFDERRHIYTLNNAPIPSVTKIMNPLSSEEYKGISRSVMENAANRGTVAHNAIETYLKYGFEDVTEECAGYFDAFSKWFADMNPSVVGSEVRVYHKLLRYAGTADLLAYIGSDLALIDYKTTSKVNSFCGIQLEAYAQALSSHGIQVQKKMILHLKKDGNYEAIFYPAGDAESWRVFGALKCLYDYKQAHK